MSFCFNFEVETQAAVANENDNLQNKQEHKLAIHSWCHNQKHLGCGFFHDVGIHNLKKRMKTIVKLDDSTDGMKSTNTRERACMKIKVKDKPRLAEPVKEAKEHPLPNDPYFLLADAVAETVHIGALPPLHFLNETVFEKTAAERDDEEKILSHTLQQKSDLISGVYEGGLKVWECTYDLLKLIEKDIETFGSKMILDLGCGAGLLGILALKRGARGVHFQDYNSTVIEQLTVPTVILNCQEDDVDSEEDEKEKGKGKVQDKSDCVSTDDKGSKDGNPPQKKQAIDPSLHTLLSKCRFFSGDWSTFLSLLLKETTPLKYDIILTSETIYNTDYYPSLHDTLQELLAPKGLVYLATKSHYFGVGGGMHLFEAFVEKMGVFSVDHLWDGEEGLQRHIVSLKFKQAEH